MTKKDLILIGGGGHCRSCIDVIESEGHFNVAGIVDEENKRYQKVLGYEIIASDKDLPDLAGKHSDFLIAIGSIKDSNRRSEKFEYIKQLGGQFPVIISSLAHVSKHASIGEGTIVMHRVVVNAAARVGKNCIINTLALVEHDSKIGDHCHISTGSIINGTCNIGNRVFIGSNTVVANNIDIGDDVIVGAGSFVTKPIDKAGFYIGNPARRTNSDGKP